jgi:hypothetical protein
MMGHRNLYNSLLWRTVAARARARDGNRCTVSRLLGGACTGTLHVHHIVAVSEGGPEFDLENLGTVCAAHHPLWESLRRVLVRRLTAPVPRCPHHHRSAEARKICEARLARLSGHHDAVAA